MRFFSAKPQSNQLSLSQKEDLRLNRVEDLVRKIQSKEPYAPEELHQILACYSFFHAIHQTNPLAYQSLMQHIQLQSYGRGRVICMHGEKALKTFFILKGKLGVFVRAVISSDKNKNYKEEYGEELIPEQAKSPSLKRKNTIIQQQNSALTFSQRKQREYKKVFESEEEIYEWYPYLTRVGTMDRQETVDVSALRKNITRAATLITEEKCLIVSLSKSSYFQISSKHDISSVPLEDRLDILRGFPIFSAWEKKLNTMSVYFERRRFRKGQPIYREGTPAQCFYLIVEGDVELITTVKGKKEEVLPDNLHQAEEGSPTTINILGPGNYFGEQEILKKCPRKVTAQPLTAFTEVLYLTKKNFFLVGYGTDFFYQLKSNLEMKVRNRESIMSKHGRYMPTLDRNSPSPEKTEVDCSSFIQKRQDKSRLSKINNHAPQQDSSNVVYLHGRKILRPKQQTNDKQKINFSMLKCNKEQYEKTHKKFVRFRIKYKGLEKEEDVEQFQEGKKKSQTEWSMNLFLKVLNLDGVMPQDIVSRNNRLTMDKEAIRDYYKSNRLSNSLHQARSIRPKTSSSHRQKLIYVNYLAGLADVGNRKQSLAN